MHGNTGSHRSEGWWGWTIPVVLGVSLVLFLATPESASVAQGSTEAARSVQYRDSGTDPNDARNGVADIRSSTRTVKRHDGRRYLRIVVRTQAKLSTRTWLAVKAALDSRRGHKPDYYMGYVIADGMGRCYLQRRWLSPTGTEGKFRFRSSGAISCSVRLRAVEPTKKVRWKLLSFDGGSPYGRRVDHAPDAGWYR